MDRPNQNESALLCRNKGRDEVLGPKNWMSIRLLISTHCLTRWLDLGLFIGLDFFPPSANLKLLRILFMTFSFFLQQINYAPELTIAFINIYFRFRSNFCAGMCMLLLREREMNALTYTCICEQIESTVTKNRFGFTALVQ